MDGQKKGGLKALYELAEFISSQYPGAFFIVETSRVGLFGKRGLPTTTH